MRKTRLTKEERQVEEALVRGEFRNVSQVEFERIADAIASRKKDAVLHIRVNGEDLRNIKKRANKLGIRYQTFIAELLHRVA